MTILDFRFTIYEPLVAREGAVSWMSGGSGESHPSLTESGHVDAAANVRAMIASGSRQTHPRSSGVTQRLRRVNRKSQIPNGA
jgi:hypothetical protein